MGHYFRFDGRSNHSAGARYYGAEPISIRYVRPDAWTANRVVELGIHGIRKSFVGIRFRWRVRRVRRVDPTRRVRVDAVTHHRDMGIHGEFVRESELATHSRVFMWLRMFSVAGTTIDSRLVVETQRSTHRSFLWFATWIIGASLALDGLSLATDAP